MLIRTPEFCNSCPDKGSKRCQLPSVSERVLDVAVAIGSAFAASAPLIVSGSEIGGLHSDVNEGSINHSQEVEQRVAGCIESHQRAQQSES